MEDEPCAYMGMRPLSGVPPLRRKDATMKEEFSRLMQTKLYALLEAFLAEEEKDFKGFKRLWAEQRFSALYHVAFGNITRPEITYVMLRECLASLLQAISLYDWSIEQQRYDSGGGLFLWHVVGCTYALYSAYECQITPIKQKILLHLDGAVAVAKIPTWTFLWRRSHPVPTRQVERMLQHLEAKGAFCKCARGYAFPPGAVRLPAAPPDGALALDQLTLSDSTAEVEDTASTEEVLPFALDTGDIERLHKEYLEAMATFRVLPKQGKAAAGPRRRAAVLFNMPPTSAQQQLAGFVESLHRVLHPETSVGDHVVDEPSHSSPTASNQPIQDEAALAAILQADLESELLDDDDTMDETTASSAPLRTEDEANASDRGRQETVGIERGDESAVHAIRDDIGAELDSDDDDNGWAQDLEDEMTTSSSQVVSAAAPTTVRSSVAVELSLSSSNSSDDDDDDAAFEAELEASVLAGSAVSTSQESRMTPATASTSTRQSMQSIQSVKSSSFQRDHSSLPPTSVWTKDTDADKPQPVASGNATPHTEAPSTRSTAPAFNMNVELSGLSSSSPDSRDSALDELERELVPTSATQRRDGVPTESASGTEPGNPATLEPPPPVATVVQPRQAKPETAASLAPQTLHKTSAVTSEPAARRVDPVRPRSSQPTARSLARSRAREMLLQPPPVLVAEVPRQLQSTPALPSQPRGVSSAAAIVPIERVIVPTTTDTLAPPAESPVALAPEPAPARQIHPALVSLQVQRTVTAVSRPREVVSLERNGVTLPPPPSTNPVSAPSTSGGPQRVAIQPSQSSARQTDREVPTSLSPTAPVAVRPTSRANEPEAPRTILPRPVPSISQAEKALKTPAMRRQIPTAAPATKPVTVAHVSSATTVQRDAGTSPRTMDPSRVHRIGRHSDDSSDGLDELEKELGVASTVKRVAPKETKPRPKPAKRPAKPAISPDGAMSTDDDDLATLEMELGILPRTSTASAPHSKPPAKRPVKPKTPRGRTVTKQPATRVASQDVSSDDDLTGLELELGIVRHKSVTTAQPTNARATPAPSKRLAKPAMPQRGAVSTDEDLAELEVELGIAPRTSAGPSAKSSKLLEIKPKARAAARKTGPQQPKQKAPSQSKYVAPASSSDSDLDALNKELGIVVAKKTRPPAATPSSSVPDKRQRVTKHSTKRTPSLKRSHAASLATAQRGSDGDGTSNDEALAELERELNATPHPKMNSIIRDDQRAAGFLNQSNPRPKKRQKTPPGPVE